MKALSDRLSFWKKVKKEYIDSGLLYLCNGSTTFDAAYNSNIEKSKIITYANDFINNTNYKGVYVSQYIGKSYESLFLIDSGNDDLRRRCRHEFIDYVINKLKK